MFLTDIIFEASKREESRRTEKQDNDIEDDEQGNPRILKSVKIVNFDFEEMDGQVNSTNAQGHQQQ